MRTSSCIATLALRMRVSMSAMGSVMVMSIASPHQLAFVTPGISPGVGELAQADAAEAELAVHGTAAGRSAGSGCSPAP